MNPFRFELASFVHINASTDHVWNVFADIASWTEWCSVCLRSDVESNFHWQPGQQISLRFRMAGVGVPFNVAVTDAETEQRAAWVSTKFTVTAVRTFTFTETPNGTIVTDHKLFTSPVLPLKLFYPRFLIRRLTDRTLADLKAECERPTT